MSISHILFDFGWVIINHKTPEAIFKLLNGLWEWYDVEPSTIRTFWHRHIDPEYMAWTIEYEDVLQRHQEYFWKSVPENHYEIINECMTHAIFYEEMITYVK